MVPLKGAATLMRKTGSFIVMFPLLTAFILGGYGCDNSDDHLVRSLIKQLQQKSGTYYYLKLVGNEQYVITKRPLFSDTRPVADAAECLGYMGQKANNAVPALIWALNRYSNTVGGDGGSSDQSSVAMALGRIGDARAIEPLLSILQSNNPGKFPATNDVFYLPGCSSRARLSNGTIARALGMIGPDARAAVPYLIEIIKEKLNDEDENTLIEQLVLLCKDQKIDSDYILIIKRNIRSQYDYDRVASAEALAKIKDPKAVQPLIGLLDDRSQECVKAAAEALGEFGPEAKEALPSLRNISNRYEGKDDSKWAAYSLKEAIRKIDH
jgi:HEAT repeat protein